MNIALRQLVFAFHRMAPLQTVGLQVDTTAKPAKDNHERIAPRITSDARPLQPFSHHLRTVIVGLRATAGLPAAGFFGLGLSERGSSEPEMAQASAKGRATAAVEAGRTSLSIGISRDGDVLRSTGQDRNGDLGATRVWATLPGERRRLAGHFLAKRLTDIALAGLAIVALMPLILLIALLIRIESRGPAIFTQIRWGRDGRKINVYKFRSMYIDRGDRSGIAQTVKDDPRITRIGRTIRRLNIDELPQLINVLKGDMSLVGPRCHAVGMLAAGVPYETLVPDYHRRHAMRPGMTGLAQMRGLRGPTDRASRARARIACDLHYVEHFSIWLDLRIIIGTIIAEFRGGKGF